MASQQGIPRKFSEKIAILERKQNEEEQQVLWHV
jgi:Transducer of regulated CREB activity, N terminus